MQVEPNFVFNFYLTEAVFLVLNKFTQTDTDVLCRNLELKYYKY